MGKIAASDTLATLLWLALAFALLMAAGCGTTREETQQRKTVERVETLTGPLVADIPLVGQVVVQPVRHVMQRTQDTVTNTTEERRITMPEASAFMAAAPALAGPLGIAGTLLGAITTAAAGWAAMRRGKTAREEAEARAKAEADAERLERQRNEIIDGIERAKPELERHGNAWPVLTETLEKEQSKDTVKVVKERVG